MSHLKKENGLENQIFKWGTKRGVGRLNKEIQFYESFTYDGVKYCLHDCVCFYREGDSGANIGKLVQIFETAAHERMVRAVWFFCPKDIRNFLGDYKPNRNELFLASGKGKGLSNVNRVESIVGKCNVVCASNDHRNHQASEQQLEMADYIFYRSFDVGTCSISESFADQICGFKVELFFNKRRNQMLGNPGTLEPKVKELTGKSVVLEKMNRHAVKDGKLGRSSPVVKESKTRTNVDDKQHFSNKPYKSKFSEDPWPPNASCTRPYKKRKLLGEKGGQISDEVGFGFRQDSGVKTVNKSVQVTRNQDPRQGKELEEIRNQLKKKCNK
ncbi:hypothetical protein NC653_001917 [Populus alba x Populus x berolinensis]|uniref:BAH domain-containing protein n=1 Tax=Populus alba x Populus x berolinensis TaxID=444605 RepID=A0AAD6RNK0_9ROSI|nr:hypothetical protein NC653_001917 [Populus alba x Populus x berolinensis]